MLNVNRNINLATPLVKKGGKGPDILPYLTNLRMFIYYTDLPSNTILTGKNGDIFVSESRWKPYYQESTLSASVSGTILNTLTASSQQNYSVVSRSVGEGPYFTGSLANPPTVATNQVPTQGTFVCISGSSALNDMSSSWSFVTYLKADNTYNPDTFEFGNAAQTLYSKVADDGSSVCKTAALELAANDPNSIIVTTGNQTGFGPNPIISASFNSPSIDFRDGNYHMITITVSDFTASVYVDNQLASGSFSSAGLDWTNHGGVPNRPYKNLIFGGNVAHSTGGTGGTQYYRAFMGRQKAIAIYNKTLNLSDVQTLYSIFQRDDLAAGINVDINT